MTEERLAIAETQLAALDRRVSDGFSARDKALDVALQALNGQLTVMNEFRGAMSDQASKFITRGEHEQLMTQITQQALDAKSVASEYVPKIDMQTMTGRMESVEKAQTAMQARYAMVALVFSTLVVVANLIAVWWHQVLPTPPIGH